MPGLAEAQLAPYAGQQSWMIKALSGEDLAAWLRRKGIGMAKRAELNSSPGPVHGSDVLRGN
jgi:hypothetical protein